MKKHLTKWILGACAASIIITTSSCKKDNETVKKEQTKGNYVLAVQAEGDAEVSTDYLVTTDNLTEGQVSIIGNGIEQSAYHFYQQTGKYLTTVTYTDANTATVYALNDKGSLEEKTKFSIGRTHLFYPLNGTEFIAMNIPRGGSENATFYQVNVVAGSVMETATSVYTPTNGSSEQAYFSGMTLRGDKLFVPFFQIASSAFDSEFTDTAYVAVYSYPSMQYEKTITDSRTGPIGAYAAQGHIFTTENGDIYTLSPCSIASGAPKETKQSGILRIKNGETDFDPDYFFNVEETTGFKICNADYLGDNKVLASILTYNNATDADKWSRRDVKLAVIDVVAKTVNYISGVPIHYGGPTATFANHYLVDNGKVHIKITTDEGTFMYEVDTDTYTGTKGTEIIGGKAVYGVFNLQQ